MKCSVTFKSNRMKNQPEKTANLEGNKQLLLFEPQSTEGGKAEKAPSFPEQLPAEQRTQNHPILESV